MSDDVRTEVGFDVDRGSVADAIAAYKSIAAEAKVNQVLVGELIPTYIKLARTIKKEFKEVADSVESSFSKITSKITKSGKQIGSDVGTAISRQSQRTGRSVARLAQGDISAVSELSESLPELAKGAKSAVKSVIGSKGIVQGMIQLSAAGVAAAVAVAALAIVVSDLVETAEEQTRALGATIDAQRQIEEEIKGGLTSEEAQQRIKDLEELAAAEQLRNDKLKEGREELDKALGGKAVTDVVGFLGSATGIDPRIKSLGEETKKSSDLLADYTAQISEYNDAITEGSLAANDAAIAEEEATKEREKAAEEIKKLVEKSTAEAQRAAEKAANAQRKYTESLSDAAIELSRGLAAASESAARASRDLENELKEAATGATRAANDARIEADIDFFEESKRNHRENVRAINDIIKQGNRDQKDLIADRDFLSADQLSKDAKRALEDIKDNAEAEKEELEIATGEKIEELRRNLMIERREQKIAARAKRRDQIQQSREEIQDLRQANQQKLSDLKTSLERELTLASQGISKKLELEGEYWSQSIGRMQQLFSQSGLAGPNRSSGGSAGDIFNSLSVSGANLSANEIERLMLKTLNKTGMTQNGVFNN